MLISADQHRPDGPRAASAPVVKSKQIPTPHRQWLNLAYATRSGYERLDLYVPARHPASSRPPGLVVYVHGGAWLEPGNVKANWLSLAFVNAFLSIGYATASINYRLSGQAHFPAQIQDVKTAVCWLRAHAARYGYDPDEIAAVGDSAGGQLVALLGTSQGVPALEGASLGYPRVSSSIKAAIVLYPDINFLAERAWLSQIPFCAGKYLNPNLADSAASKYLGALVQTVPARARAADPVTYLTSGRPLPRFLIAQGTHDCTVPYQGAVEFYQALVKVAGPAAVQLILEPGKGHVSSPADVNVTFNFTESNARSSSFSGKPSARVRKRAGTYCVIAAMPGSGQRPPRPGGTIAPVEGDLRSCGCLGSDRSLAGNSGPDGGT